MNVQRIHIVSHSGKPGAVKLEESLAEWLTQRDITLSDENPDLVVSIGGDGTMLRAAQHAHAADVPLLGVNQGTLGYLTEVDAGEETRAIEAIFTGEYQIEERMMLACEVDGLDEDRTFVGLNEVLVERDSRHRLVRLLVSVGGEHLGEFNADGVIVATPTGSTAYALSAGGPIVSPRASVLVVVPVSAHMIFSRPFVLAPDETVEITEISGPAALSLDGALGCDLRDGYTVKVRRHERTLQLVRLWGPAFVERLRRKLGLPG
jgi:NAD+ kinase